MFNVLIADDEIFVIKSLLHTIPWDMLNLNIVLTCTNGQDALDYIEHHPIDILITDIRMPGFTGLDLCSIIYNQYPHIQLIIISGYADFAYAQKAIKYNILGYCLKPIDFDELTLLLRKALAHLTTPSLPPEDIMDCIENDDYCALTHHISKNNLDPSHFYIIVSSGPEPLTATITSNKLVLKLGPHKYLYLLPQSPTTYDFTYDTLNPLKIKGLGIYPNAINTTQLKSALYDTITLSYQFFLKGTPCIQNTLLCSHHTLLFSNLNAALIANDLVLVRQIVEKLLNCSISQKYNINFALKVYNLFMSYYTNHNNLEKEDVYIYSLDQLTKKFNNFSEMLSAAYSSICEDSTLESLSASYNNNFIHVLKYIHKHYTEDITIKDVSDALHLNANYISQLFKKETGLTYTTYVTQLRIKKTKLLLTQSTLSLSEICAQVGYHDYFYFLKTFKKYEGISPTKYKIKLGIN